MKVLVAGATGATGKLLVKLLLEAGLYVIAIVRSTEKLTSYIKEQQKLEIIKASILDKPLSELAVLLEDCEAVVSCLGHNINLKGIYGKPRKLVTNAVKNLCNAIQQNNSEKPVKFILMNTTAHRNRDLKESRTFGERIVIALLRLLLPPQPDNEQAAEFLRAIITKKNPKIEWVAVRPDTLVDEEEVTKYSIHFSPVRSPIFNAGKTSRINVGHFMKELIIDPELWGQWKGQMPVIYNE